MLTLSIISMFGCNSTIPPEPQASHFSNKDVVKIARAYLAENEPHLVIATKPPNVRYSANTEHSGWTVTFDAVPTKEYPSGPLSVDVWVSTDAKIPPVTQERRESPISKEDAIKVARAYLQKKEPNIELSNEAPEARYNDTWGNRGWTIRVGGVPGKKSGWHCGFIYIDVAVSPDGKNACEGGGVCL